MRGAVVRIKWRGHYFLTEVAHTELSAGGQLQFEVTHPQMRGRRIIITAVSSCPPTEEEVRQWVQDGGGSPLSHAVEALVGSTLVGSALSAEDLRAQLRDPGQLRREREWLLAL